MWHVYWFLRPTSVFSSYERGLRYLTHKRGVKQIRAINQILRSKSRVIHFLQTIAWQCNEQEPRDSGGLQSSQTSFQTSEEQNTQYWKFNEMWDQNGFTTESTQALCLPLQPKSRDQLTRRIQRNQGWDWKQNAKLITELNSWEMGSTDSSPPYQVIQDSVRTLGISARLSAHRPALTWAALAGSEDRSQSYRLN